MKYRSKTLKIIAYLLRNELSIWRTIYFNFHYFSFPIAIKFPILLYKSVRLRKTRGQIIINSAPIKTGMIHIGKMVYGFERKQDYTIWEQIGGLVILEYGVHIGQGTFISIGKNAKLNIEQSTGFGGNDRIICCESVTIKANTIVGWDVQIIDTDFHATTNTITKTTNYSKKAIIIGRYNWLCFGCTILKGSITPDHCIVKAKSLINIDLSDAGENIVIGTEDNAKVLARYISWGPYSESEKY